MLLTPAEAGRKACVIGPGLVCQTSDCMAWRWAQKPNPKWKPRGLVYSETNPVADEPMAIEDRTRGYCGLAGRP